MSAATISRDTGLMAERSLRHAVRSVDGLLIGVLLPVFIMLLFTYVFGGAIDSGGDYVNYVVPGVILLCAAYGASSTAISVTGDLQEGIVDRFRTMGVAGVSVLGGHVIASVARNLVSTALVVLVALAIGFRPDAGAWEWLGVAGLVALFVLALSWFSAAFGLVARSVESAASLGFFLLFLPYLSSAFVPIETLPDWLQPIAEAQLFTPLNETMRALLLEGSAVAQPVAALAWCLGVLAVSLLAVAVLWRRSRRA